MNELSIEEYRLIASEWHGGQASPLYAFSSSGQIPDAWAALREIEDCLTGLHAGQYSAEEIAAEEPRLLALREFFELEDAKQSAAKEAEEEYDIPDREAAAALLTRIASVTEALENQGMDREAADMHEVFVRVAKAKSKKNVPTNPKLWAECQSWARSKYDVWPSAYALGAASRRYKEKGGKWKKED